MTMQFFPQGKGKSSSRRNPRSPSIMGQTDGSGAILMGKPPYPFWFGIYKPINDVEQAIYSLFEKLFDSYGNLKQQKRHVSRLMDLLLHKKLVGAECQSDNKYAQSIAKTFAWLKKTVAIWTEPLHQKLIEYCDRFPQGQYAEPCQEHLANLAISDRDSKEYRQLVGYLQGYVQKLGVYVEKPGAEISEELKTFWAGMKPLVFLVPRLWTFNFDPDRSNLQRSLSGWINNYLSKRINNDSDQDKCLDPNGNIMNSLDNPLGHGEDGDSLTIKDNITESDRFTDYTPPTWEEIKNNRWCTSEAEVEKFRWLKAYIEADPSDILKTLCVNQNPECNYQVLAQRLLVEGRNHGDIEKLAQEFVIKYQTLKSDLDRKFYPFILALLSDAPQPDREQLHEAIAASPVLKSLVKSKNHKSITAAWLASEVLLYHQHPRDVVQTLVKFYQRNYPGLQPFDLFVEEELDLGAFEQIHQELIELTAGYPHPWAGSGWELYSQWQWLKFKELSDRLKAQGGPKLSALELQTWWRSKVLVAIGHVITGKAEMTP